MKYLILFFISLALSQENDPNKLPSGSEPIIPTTPVQDSLYLRELNTKIPNQVRIREGLELLQFNMILKRKMRRNPWLIARKNLEEIPSEYLAAKPNELVIRDMVLRESQYVPGINQFPIGGLRLGLDDIASFLGLAEDYSPVISYEVPYPAKVEIKVYSVSALEVALLFSGLQNPGKYSKTWNGKDDIGKQLPPGDYIAEVIIDGKRTIQKMIKLK